MVHGKESTDVGIRPKNMGGFSISLTRSDLEGQEGNCKKGIYGENKGEPRRVSGVSPEGSVSGGRPGEDDHCSTIELRMFSHANGSPFRNIAWRNANVLTYVCSDVCRAHLVPL
eukprot:gb/GECG01013996.1/.p1 GENE.gb/GECG01013996.1/~~gb/GECG01013996.1/.p1  ORF type:complete len:114 (+),score=6.66 gb/GECG01013996.1/:1-342(+)